jgi:hypothetical protein
MIALKVSLKVCGVMQDRGEAGVCKTRLESRVSGVNCVTAASRYSVTQNSMNLTSTQMCTLSVTKLKLDGLNI